MSKLDALDYLLNLRSTVRVVSSLLSHGFAARMIAIIASVWILLSTLAPSSAENYSAFGFTSDDVNQFEDYKRSINECGAAFIAEPDIFKPTASMPLMTLALVAHQGCRKQLKARHVPIGVIRVEDFDRSTLCVAYAVMFPDRETVGEHQACNQPSALPAPTH